MKRLSQSSSLLLIALTLSIFTSLWNPVGYPKLLYDDGTYVGRAMHVLVTNSPQEGTFYDHPYFGQLFLAGLLWATGYPDSLHPSSEGDVVGTVEKLWLLPKLIIGIFGVLDTFLIYKISERRYNVRVAFIASVLFALMPMVWFLRTIFLESLLLPWLLTSILLAVYAKNSSKNKIFKKDISLTILSGIFFGLAIFTKITVFIMIPLYVYLLLKSSDNNWKLIGLWLIPVILIPMIWPGYALARGELNYWLHGIYWQTHRQMSGINFIESWKQNTLPNAIVDNYILMPILVGLGLAGLVYAATRRDYFLILWTVPFLIFLYVLGFVRSFHLIPLLPALSISGARLIDGLSDMLPYKKIRDLLPFLIIVSITIFLLVNIIVLFSTTENDSTITASALVSWYSHQNSKANITMISNHVYSWIPKYVFHIGYEYLIPELSVDENPRNEKILMVADGAFNFVLNGNDAVGRHLFDVYSKHSKNGTAQIKYGDGNITIPEDWPSDLKRYYLISLVDRDHFWKPDNNVRLSQNDGHLNFLVNPNETGIREATMETKLNNKTSTPLLLYLEYASNSTTPNEKYYIEIAGNSDGTVKHYTYDLANTRGKVTDDLIILPSKLEGHINFRLGIAANTSGHHLLTIKRAAILLPKSN